MKVWKLFLATLVSVLFLTGCQSAENQTGASNESQTSEEQADGEVKVYKVGVVSERAVDIWESVNERLTPAENIRVEPVIFSDFVQPNIALSEGSIDANAYQYIPFLSDYNDAHDEDLVPMGYLSVEPMGIWAQDHIQSLDDIPQNAQIAVIDDPVNYGNALTQLEKAGLIELAEDAGPTPTWDDVVSNPLNLEVIPMQSGSVPRAIADVDMVMPGATAAVASGLKIDEAIYFEDTNTTSKLFRLNFVTRPELMEDEGLQTALRYYQDDETVKFANETGDGTFYPGWNNDDNATHDYFEYVEYKNKSQNNQ